MKAAILRCLLAVVIAIGATQVRAATTLLPNGWQCFADGAGAPLVGGLVYMYVPGTTTPKTTWQGADQVVPNTNPIVLNGFGCAIIYGVGSYRQLLTNASGGLIFDLLTTDTSASNSVFWAGLSGGTPNAITLTDPGFNSTPGTIITFKALNSNTGAATISVSGSIATQIVKDTASGPVALTGGEIIAGNVVSVLLDTIGAAWHLQNTVISASSGSASPQCGATGLKITNNSGTPLTSIDVTWSSVTTLNTSGQVFSSQTPTTVTINSTASGAVNQWDAARPTSNWGNIWIVGNGSTMGAIGSASATAPTLPSGYTYKCRVGAMRFDGAQNLLRTVQYGNKSAFSVQTAGNTLITTIRATNGATGANCNTATPTWTSTSIASLVPPTATHADVYAGAEATTNANAAIAVAPNSNWGGYNTNPGPPIAIQTNFAAGVVAQTSLQASATLLLETAQTIFVCSANTGNFTYSMIYGWRDAVNAN